MSQIPSNIRDNHSNGTVADFLKQHIGANSTLSVVSAYFTIQAYHELRHQLDTIHELNFLFGEPSFINRLDPEQRIARSFTLTSEGLSLANVLTQRAAAQACAKWIRDKVHIKSIIQQNLMHGKMYHIQQGPVTKAIMGSSNFTVRGLGLSDQHSNYELNMVVDSDRDRNDLKAWFDSIWHDDTLVKDVKHDVLEYLAQLYHNNAPSFIYYKTLYHVFEKYLEDNKSTIVDLERTSLYETGIWKALYDFQKDGVKGAINKITAHNGCIVADSVGLGKTYTALAVIKYYELKNERVLVLCPRKLRENWIIYTRNDHLNPFLDDRFRFDVLSHTDIGRDTGYSGDINLATLNWGNYDLVVIDESHNFRNNLVGQRDAQGQLHKSRYRRLLDDILKSGVKTKVLMLSATPVNNDLQDLRNQIHLMTEGNDRSFATTIGVPSLNAVMADSQRIFARWAKNTQRDVTQLLAQLPSAFFTMLDAVTIARSRSHIRKYYPNNASSLSFPQRHQPVSLFPRIDTANMFLSYAKISAEIDGYKLALFSPSQYILPAYQHHYQHKGNDPFNQGTREHHLIGMMKVNFLKRLESSVYAFQTTLERTIKKISDLDQTITAFKQRQSAANVDVTLNDDAEDDELNDAMNQTVGKLQFPLAHLDLDRWVHDIRKDRDQLIALYNSACAVTPDRDQKLHELKALIQQKVQTPSIMRTGEVNRKVLIFTASADTAQYLYQELHAFVQSWGIHVAMVNGGGVTYTTFGANDFQHILTNFAPRAKYRAKQPTFPQHGEIDVLIATDCISEGQNLQDCDLVINYDIHWNPVRIIQRFGRIDRIGSPNSAIHMVNFWPTDDLNAYINLRNRVESRMALVDTVATGQDNPLQPNEQREAIQLEIDFRGKQLTGLINSVIDIDDDAQTVSLTDFTLDDFRRELLEYLRVNRDTLQKAPLGLYALTQPHPAYEQSAPGAIFCLRYTGHSDTSNQINALQPYFLVYIRSDGQVRYNFTHPKQVLDIMRIVSADKHSPDEALCRFFDQQTTNCSDMHVYADLIERAVAQIRDAFTKRIATQTTTSRGFVIPKLGQQVQSVADFTLITWMVILP